MSDKWKAIEGSNDTQQTNQDVVRICLHNEVGTQSSEEDTKLCARE